MTPAQRDPQDLIPLTPAVFHILLALGKGRGHGYAVMQEVERLTDGQVRLGPGTLYRSMQKMLVDGFIVERRPRAGSSRTEDERRRYYALTPFGRRVAQAEADRLATLVRAAQECGFRAGGRARSRGKQAG